MRCVVLADDEQLTASVTSPRESHRTQPVFEFDASRHRFLYAYNDFKKALSNPRLIFSITKKDFGGRYRNTSIGPLWITVSTGLTIAGLALLYGKIFGIPLQEYFPYVACGIIIWGVVSSIFNSGAGAFAASTNTFDQMPISKSVFAFRSIGTAFLAFLYKIPVLAAAMIWAGVTPTPMGVLVSIGGFMLLIWSGFWCTLIVGTIGLRFRDTGQAISALMSAVFFFTPVFWRPDRLGELSFIVDLNPFFHFLNIIRGPLIGLDGVSNSFIWAGSFAVVLTLMGALVFGLFARRFSYWS